MVQWVRLHAPNAGDPGSIPGWGTRSHVHAATKSLHAARKIPCAPTKTQHNQHINKYLKKNEIAWISLHRKLSYNLKLSCPPEIRAKERGV